MTGGAYVVIAFLFGLLTGIVGRRRGSSFLIWFAVGAVLPVLGLVAAIVYPTERDEPLRRCPRCGRVHRLRVQVCSTCGEDLFLPDPSDVRQPRSLRRMPRAREP